jgi:hypothetical protein
MTTEQIVHRYQPRDWQAEVHSLIAGARYSVVIVHRRGGKTVMAVNTLIAAAIAAPNGRYAYAAPLLKQSKSIAWNLLKDFTEGIPGVQFRETELRVIFPNGSEIALFAGESHDTIRGQGFDGVVLDEVAQFPIDAWGSSIRPTLSDREGWALFIGTPRGLDQLHEFFIRGQDPSHPEWVSAIYPATETGVLSSDEIESARQAATTPSQFQREYLCDFSASVDDVLIPLPLVSAAMQRSTNHEIELRGMPKVIGVDVARYGSDRTVFFQRWGKQTLPPIIIEDSDLMYVVGRLAKIIDQWVPDAVFIDVGGVGAGVVDRMLQLGCDVIAVNFGERSIDPGYSNRRVEMWDGMKRWLEDGGVLPNINGLQADLSAPTFSFDASNRMKLERKDEIRKRLGASTDLGDALALTFAMPVMAAEEPGQPQLFDNNRAKTDYDPMEAI